jgi:hypothetical protein
VPISKHERQRYRHPLVCAESLQRCAGGSGRWPATTDDLLDSGSAVASSSVRERGKAIAVPFLQRLTGERLTGSVALISENSDLVHQVGMLRPARTPLGHQSVVCETGISDARIAIGLLIRSWKRWTLRLYVVHQLWICAARTASESPGRSHEGRRSPRPRTPDLGLRPGSGPAA